MDFGLAVVEFIANIRDNNISHDNISESEDESLHIAVDQAGLLVLKFLP